MMTTTAMHRPMDNDALRRVAPSIFAETPWHGNDERRGMSERYGFVPTVQVIDAMRDAGLVPVYARQSRTRIEGKSDFTRHMVRFRRHDAASLAVGDVFPELVLINSHDGTSAYELSAGMFRLACLNGMCVDAGTIAAVKARHARDVAGEVIEASFRVLDETPKALEQVADWQRTALPAPAQHALASAALALRYDEPEDAPVEPAQLLRARRWDDRGDDLWSTMSRVQENLLRGGLRGSRDPRTGRRRSMRAVGAINEDVRLNRALWTLATALRQAV